MARISSLSEKPLGDRPRRLAHWLNPTGEKKFHSLVDKVYKLKNLELAWEKVKRNRGSGGVDGQSIDDFMGDVERNLKKLHDELRTDTYRPQPVKRQLIPKSGQPGKFRPLGIPTVYDRVCQQALLNRLEPIFESVFDEASFGYRRGRSAKDALRKIWGEVEQGFEWVVDADLKDFFGSADHEKLLVLLNQQVADGRVLALLESIMKVGYLEDGKVHQTQRGVPQGGLCKALHNPPCGVPLRLAFPPLTILFTPLSSSPITGALSHRLIRCKIPPSTMRSATTAISLACGMLSKYFDRSASMTRV